MLIMPLAGGLADRTGVGKLVPVGLFLIGVSFAALTQIRADTSYWLFGGLMVIMGMGMGLTLMPIMTGAMQTLKAHEVARASTALNIIQQVASSVGTAVLSVLLSRFISDKLTAGGVPAGSAAGDQRGALAQLPPRVLAHVQELMASA